LVEKDDLSSFPYVPTRTPVLGEDGDGEVFRDDLQTTAVHEVGTDLNNSPFVEGEEEISEKDSPTLSAIES